MRPSESVRRQRRGAWCLAIALAVSLGALSRADEVVLTAGRRVASWVLGKTESYWIVSTERGIEILTLDVVDSVIPSEEGPAGTGVGGVAGMPASGGELPAGRRIALTIRASVGDETLQSSHADTRSRVGYFLEQQCEPPFDLLDATVALEQADYEMAIDANCKEEGQITFYGPNLGYRHRCRLKFELRRRVGPRVRTVESLTVVEDVTGSEENRETLDQQAYDQAIKTLTQRLADLPFFGGDGSATEAASET